MSEPDPLEEMDRIYFFDATWAVRLKRWVELPQNSGFAASNRTVAENALNEPAAGLRAVVNIGAAALLSLVPDFRYQNLYDKPLVGGKRRDPTPTRVSVDKKLAIRPERTYFAAVALGGAGVRYYGEYCLVLYEALVPEDTQLLDRDSYDLLLPPLAAVDPVDPLSSRVVQRIRGTWGIDLRDMVLMRVLPEMVSQPRLVTSGTISGAVLRDQEFIEVHLELAESFSLRDVEEVRESPDEVAVEMRLRSRRQSGQPLSEVERLWLQRRELVSIAMNDLDKRTRVVMAHGQGYQWK